DYYCSSYEGSNIFLF
nr:immunoglobulin light chain junction region [Macaca mulatta]MOW02139.1 immunoglobulin light chain junction region [Macaca mulatta]MOW02219.1 immunoglobulin light chain junction region [Macaca mulatta]MOW02328.1 immunoglobulin light chain junction region [Macaca mulatta]MOW02705.1 immunoglobulin light chain junction region [Macaca mulatta]